MTQRATVARPVGTFRTVLLLGLLDTFGPLSMDLYLPALPQLAATLGTTDALAQATMSVCMLGLGLGQLVVGPLSDRWGRRVPLICGVALFALLSAVCALAPTIEVLLAARALQGLCGAAGVVVAFAVARDLFSGAQLSRVLSLLALVSASAPVLAPVAGGQLARVMDWRGIFWVLAVAGVLLVAAAWRLPETLPAGRRSAGGARAMAGQFAHVLRDRLFVSLLCISALGGIGFFAYLSMSSFVVQNQFGFTPQLFSAVFALNALANMAGAQVSRVLVARWGTGRTYLAGQAAVGVAAAALLVAAVTNGSPFLFLGFLSLYLMATGISSPNATTLALEGHGARAGTAAAVFGTASFAVGPVVAPLASLGGATALTMAATIGLGAVAASVLAFVLVRPAAPR
ncbi:multidrug effflux MFS transporter [Arthrobacter ginkgonis]|uniref:Multidrug effflux MFS transporter n=1 Tax=Arthrobacter ginkgonis TaxID=1630594 RepID=A0ABP7CZU9_9MICC